MNLPHVALWHSSLLSDHQHTHTHNEKKNQTALHQNKVYVETRQKPKYWEEKFSSSQKQFVTKMLAICKLENN